MTAPDYVILVWMIELAAEEREKRIILVGLLLKGAQNGMSDSQIADAPTPDF